MQIHATTSVHVHTTTDGADAITSVFIKGTSRGHAVIDFTTGSADDTLLTLFMHDPEALESLGQQALALAEEMREHRELVAARAAKGN